MKKNYVKYIGIAVFIVVCGLCYLFLGNGMSSGTLFSADDNGLEEIERESEESVLNAKGQDDIPESPDKKGTSEGDSQASDENSDVYIHIMGAVKKPGVYVFKKNPRIVDVVKAAGGFRKNAAGNSINLAESLEDGTQINIETKKQYKNRLRKTADMALQNGSQRGTGAGDQISGGKNGDSVGTNSVNINEAGADELMTLPGIGKSKADAIISYRETEGKFKTPEDLMNISGIKNGVFDKIKDNIIV